MAACPHAHVTANQLADGTVTVTCDDCLATLQTLPAASPDAIVTQVTALHGNAQILFPFIAGRGW